jgi:hypothetical protein
MMLCVLRLLLWPLALVLATSAYAARAVEVRAIVADENTGQPLAARV